MKLWITTALIALITVSAYPAMADHLSGSALVSRCDADSAQYMCIGYIEGVYDGYQAGTSSLGGQPPWCIPEDTTLDQLARVVMKRLKERPEELHYSADILVSYALRKAFPCD